MAWPRASSDVAQIVRAAVERQLLLDLARMVMRVDSKLDRVLEALGEDVAKRKKTPEERAAWEAERAASAEDRRRLAATIESYERWLEERRARYERRRRVINRLSLGLLARR